MTSTWSNLCGFSGVSRFCLKFGINLGPDQTLQIQSLFWFMEKKPFIRSTVLNAGLLSGDI
jgi:hypothetical protein